MREIRHIIVHCTATQPEATVRSILSYWQRIGWKNPGYHYIIRRDGTIEQLLDEDKTANGARGYNSHAIHVSYIGGIDAKGKALDTRTAEQKTSLRRLLRLIHSRYPAALIISHRDIAAKACPSFDATSEYRDI